jgi:hypothetical protein
MKEYFSFLAQKKLPAGHSNSGVSYVTITSTVVVYSPAVKVEIYSQSLPSPLCLSDLKILSSQKRGGSRGVPFDTS